MDDRLPFYGPVGHILYSPHVNICGVPPVGHCDLSVSMTLPWGPTSFNDVIGSDISTTHQLARAGECYLIEPSRISTWHCSMNIAIKNTPNYKTELFGPVWFGTTSFCIHIHNRAAFPGGMCIRMAIYGLPFWLLYFLDVSQACFCYNQYKLHLIKDDPLDIAGRSQLEALQFVSSSVSNWQSAMIALVSVDRTKGAISIHESLVIYSLNIFGWGLGWIV